MHVCVIRDKHLKNFRSWLSLRKFTCWASIHSSRLWRENRRTVLLWCWIYTSPHFKLTDEYFKTDWIKSISNPTIWGQYVRFLKRILKIYWRHSNELFPFSQLPAFYWQKYDPCDLSSKKFIIQRWKLIMICMLTLWCNRDFLVW